MSLVCSFPPIENPKARVLILGSMPSERSLLAGQYYAHPQNAFWRIMGELFGAGPPVPYKSRLAILRRSGVALWDVMASCSREGSLDSGISRTSIVPNDFRSFFLRHPAITHVFFNGGEAQRSYLKHVGPGLEARSLLYQRLPSTSPANAAFSYARKLRAWRALGQAATQTCRA